MDDAVNTDAGAEASDSRGRRSDRSGSRRSGAGPVRMHGSVRSFVGAKRFGFIDGEDGQSYFFHANGLTDPTSAGDIAIGALVEFEPHPGPKGLEARRVIVERSKGELWTLPEKLVICRDSKLRHGEIFAIGGPVTCWSDSSPDTARRELLELAESLGANAVLGLAYTKRTGSSGNYQFTVHRFTASLAVIAESRPSADLDRIRASELHRDEAAAEFVRRHQEYIQRLAEEEAWRGKQIVWMAVFVVLMVFVLAVASRIK